MTKILGIDIGNGLAVCCLLDSTKEHDNPSEETIDANNFHHFRATKDGLERLLKLNANIAVLEPTGGNYSKLWITALETHGVEVKQVNHAALARHREHLGLPDKDDERDAYALAHYGIINLKRLNRFNFKRDDQIIRIREISLRLMHLTRCQSPIINRLKQDLAWQFPEISKHSFQRATLQQSIPVLWLWLAGLSNSPKWIRQYEKSCGLGLTDTAKANTARLIDIHKEEIILEQELMTLLKNPDYKPYLEVFKSYGMGIRISAVLLAQIYPLSKFLGEDGQEIIVTKKGRISKKPTKRHISQRKFQKTIGTAPKESSSGDKTKKSKSGSGLCRIALWQWIYVRIEPIQNRRNCPKALAIYNWAKDPTEPKRSGAPIKLWRSKVAAHASRLIWKDLVKAIVKPKPPEEPK